MGLHRVDLPLDDLADVDRRAKPVSRPALRLHREGLHVVGELFVDLADAVDEVRGRDEAIAPTHVPVRAKCRLVSLDARELDRLERALAGGDVVGMAVAAVGTPRDDHVRPDPPQPADDVPHHFVPTDTGEGSVGVCEAGGRREPHAASRFGELGRAHRPEALAGHDGTLGIAHPALVALGEAEAVHADALVGVLDQRATDAERLVVGMREDRPQNERIFHRCGTLPRLAFRA